MKNKTCGSKSSNCISAEKQAICAKCTNEKAEKEAFQRELEAYRSSWEVRINSGL